MGLKLLKFANSLGLRYRVVGGLLALELAGSLFEGIGVALLLPLFELFDAGGEIGAVPEGTPFLGLIETLFTWAGLSLTLGSLTTATVGCLLLRSTFVYARQVFKARVRHGLLRDIRSRMFRECLLVSVEDHEQRALGDLANDVLVEAERAVRTLILTIVVAGSLALFVGYVAIMLTVSPLLTIAMSGLMGMEAMMLGRILRQTRREGAAFTEANRHLSVHVMERLKFLRHVLLSGTGRAERDAGRRLTRAQCRRSIRIARLTALGGFVVELLLIITLFASFWLGHTMLGLSLATLLVFFGMLLRTFLLAKNLVGKFQKLLAQYPGFANIRERFGELAAARERETGTVTFQGVREAIRFEDVRFSYDGDDARPALDRLSAEIPGGQTTAIVGPSGAGKSTLIDLIWRLRECDGPGISIDGTPISEFSLDSLRRGIGYAPQEPMVFDTTLAEHIRYGRADASDDDVAQAAELAGLSAFISALADGMDTRIGESGVRLSGGQRQRLDLARALVARTPLLILDEPSRGLDADAEHLFRETLRRIRLETDTTVIVVAHSLSTVSEADLIIVLDGGRVADYGTHRELVQRDGWYSKAFVSQSDDAGALAPMIA